MNLIYKTSAFFIACICSYNLYAQPGRPNIVKQPPRINSVLKATTNVAAKVKIHANSNSVFGNANTHPNYDKKKQQKKSEIKTEEEIKKNNKGKKQKK